RPGPWPPGWGRDPACRGWTGCCKSWPPSGTSSRPWRPRRRPVRTSRLGLSGLFDQSDGLAGRIIGEDYWCRRIIDVSSFLRIIDVSSFFAEKRTDINNHVHYLPLMTRPASIHATTTASTTPAAVISWKPKEKL